MRKRLAAKTNMPEDDDTDTITSVNDTKVKGKKRVAPDDDEVLLAARERKRVALEQSKIAAEELAAAVKDHGHLRNLGEVETFSVDFNAARASAREDRSARWNPLWNGRKNFKKFRKAKQSISVGLGRDIIQLVDYKNKSGASQGILPPLLKWINGQNSFLRCRRGPLKRAVELQMVKNHHRMISHWILLR